MELGKQSFRVWLGLVACSSLIIAGCPSNSGSQAPTPGSTTAGSTSSGGRTFNPGGTAVGGGTDSGNGAAFITLTRALRSNVDPNSILELIGSNGDIGNNCPDQNSCRCVFTWNDSTGVRRESEAALVRAETNMARCPFTTVSPDAGRFEVKLRILAANLFSNGIQVFMPAMNPSLDASLSSNYLPIQRYMCRDIMQMRHNTQFYRSNSLLDPQLWDRSIAFTFYTHSLGLDYGAVPFRRGTSGQPTQVPGFECPAVPNDPSENPIYDYRIFSRMGVKLDDLGKLEVDNGDGDNTIFPTDDNLGLDTSKCATGKEPTCEKFLFNRHDFYLATFKSGIFKEPVCVRHKVGNLVSGTLDCTGIDSATTTVTLDSAVAANKDVIGFAAVPGGDQRCPDPNVVKIPTGKKWAKIWRFAYAYDQRKVREVANADDIGSLFCTTREAECLSNHPGVRETETFTPPTGGGAINNMRVVSSVCYNVKKGAGPRIGAAVGPTVGGGMTDPGFGNCDDSGDEGDGNGPRAIISGPATLGPVGCYPTDYSTPGDTTSRCFATPRPCINEISPGQVTANCCQDTGTRTANGNLRPANFTPGGRWCNPSLIGNTDASSVRVSPRTGIGNNSGGHEEWPGSATQGTLAQDVWLIGNGGRKACIEADTDAQGRLRTEYQNLETLRPQPYLFTTKVLDSESVRDYLYIVTPDTVTVEQMENPDGPIARRFWPFRTVDGADISGKFEYSIDSDSKTTGVPGERLSKFPLCVLQDAKQGQIEGTAP